MGDERWWKRTDVPSLSEYYAYEEEEEEHACAYPAIGDERCGFVEVGLVLLCGIVSAPFFMNSYYPFSLFLFVA